MMFEEQKVELRRLRNENTEIKDRLHYLEGLAASTMSNNGVLDMEIVSSYQVQMVNDMSMINELEIVGVGANGQGNESLPNLIGECSFGAGMNNSLG